MSQLRMEKDDLDSVPLVAVPHGYALRTFCLGEEAALGRVYAAAQLGCDSADLVHERMLQHPCFKPERIFVVEHRRDVVGTCSAWVEPSDPGCGYLHMMGVMPEHRGKGLGRLLAVSVIRYARAEGYDRQRLSTDDWREGALRLYLGLGFYPLIDDDTHPARWQAIAEKLDQPGILTRARDLRAAPGAAAS